MRNKCAIAGLSLFPVSQPGAVWNRATLIRLAFCVCLCFPGCSADRQKQPPRMENAAAVPVVVVPVLQKTVPLYAEFAAKAAARDTVELRARVESFLEEILFEEGRMVKQGQLLFTLDNRKYEADLQSAKAELAKAHAGLRMAQENVIVEAARAKVDQAKAQKSKADTDVSRLQPLAREKAVPQRDLDDALVQQEVAISNLTASQANYETVVLNLKVSVEQARAAVSAAEASVKNAELNLSYCAIRAPISGLIGQRMVSRGNLVGRGEPTLLATISALDPIRISFALSEMEYLQLVRRMAESAQIPRSVELILADGTTFAHKGKVTIEDRAVDEKTGTLTIIAEFPNPEGLLRPGQFGRLRGVIDTIENAILIPQRSVMEEQSSRMAYIVGPDNKVAFRSLTLGERVENWFVVKEGVHPGERVMIEGLQKVRPGMLVAPAMKSPETEK